MQTVSLEKSVAMIPDGAKLMIGGFMAVGTPERVIDELVRQNKRDLTVIANDTAVPTRGIGKLISGKLVRKAVVSHIGLNPETQRQMMAGELEVDLCRKHAIECIRAGGHGPGGILTPTGWHDGRKPKKRSRSARAIFELRCRAAGAGISRGLSRKLSADGALQSGHGNGGGHRHRQRRQHCAVGVISPTMSARLPRDT